MSFQTTLSLAPRHRGFHLITDEVQQALRGVDSTGVLHLFIQHTSASLTINENADPTVRQDLESYFTRAVPEGQGRYTHDYEGEDDMPAHIKASLLGSAITVPIARGQLQLGTWQGIYLCEHRNHASSRTVVLTVIG